MKRNILSLVLAGLMFFGLAGAAQAEPAKPRVISLYAAHTEVLLRLGAKDNIIGVSAQETYRGPETEGWTPPVFSIRDDVEKFLAAKPDIVLVRPMHMAAGSRLVETLQSTGVNVYSAQVVRAGDLYQYWRDLAKLVGREDEAEKMILDFDAAVSVYHQAAARRAEADKPGVFIEAIHDRIKTFTPDSLPIWLVELAGGRNAAADAKPQAPGLIIAEYGPERLLAKAGQVDIFISQLGPMNLAPLKRVKGREIYRPLRAFKDGRVYKIGEEILARPTPSLLVGLKQLAEWTGLQDELPNDAALTEAAPEATAEVPAQAPAEDDDAALEDAGNGSGEVLPLKVDLPPGESGGSE